MTFTHEFSARELDTSVPRQFVNSLECRIMKNSGSSVGFLIVLGIYVIAFVVGTFWFGGSFIPRGHATIPTVVRPAGR